jgi:hypothetical protein
MNSCSTSRSFSSCSCSASSGVSRAADCTHLEQPQHVIPIRAGA